MTRRLDDRVWRSALLGLALWSSVLTTPAFGEARPFDAFEPNPGGYSWINSYLLTLASNLAYRGLVQDEPGETFREKFAHVYEPLGFEVVAFLE
ncbi:MAG: hypothetical protein AAF560_13965, partial [Acidobacteriota bacterium]